MKTISLAIACTQLAICATAQTFTSLASVPGANREGSFCFSAGDHIYVGGGSDLNDLKRYDPANDIWASAGLLPGTADDRWYSSGFTINGKGYMCLGFDGPLAKQDLWEFDPVTGIWTEKASFPGTPRVGATVFVVDGKAYVGAGTDFFSTFSDFYAYDPVSNEWSGITAPPVSPDAFLAGFSIGNTGYVLRSNTLVAYDPQTDAWSERASFPGTPRIGSVAFELNGQGIVGMGGSFTTYTSETAIYTYTPWSDSWSHIDDIPGPGRIFSVGCSHSGTGYMGCGEVLGSSTAYHDWKKFELPVGTAERAEGKSTVLVPNPATTHIRIVGSRHPAGELRKARMHDPTGAVVWAGTMVEGGLIEISGLPAGSYVLVIDDETGSSERHLFIKTD